MTPALLLAVIQALDLIVREAPELIGLVRQFKAALARKPETPAEFRAILDSTIQASDATLATLQTLLASMPAATAPEAERKTIPEIDSHKLARLLLSMPPSRIETEGDSGYGTVGGVVYFGALEALLIIRSSGFWINNNMGRGALIVHGSEG